jgi:flavin reductase (DIM6/NTAB) family NADH-FMN oxidoreductase RutF
MEFDISKLTSADCYRLLTSLIVPRPIAFVTTINTQGEVNAAPFSYFNLMGNDPPIVALGIGKDEFRKNGLKDSAYNIQQTREFVINIVNESIIKQVNLTSADFPPGFDETEAAGLTKIPSVKIIAPRIKEAPAHLECRHVNTLEVGNTRVTLGEVIYLHVAKEFVDEENIILTELIHPLGRMHQGGFYTRTTNLFNLPCPTYKEWKEQVNNK